MTDVESYFAYLSHPETAQLDGDSKTPETLPSLTTSLTRLLIPKAGVEYTSLYLVGNPSSSGPLSTSAFVRVVALRAHDGDLGNNLRKMQLGFVDYFVSS